MSNDVTTRHSDYQDAAEKWRLCEDAAAGEQAVKEAKEKYLPRPNPEDHSLENQARYRAYVLRAVYYNATGRTLQGLLGLAFAEPPAIAVPAAIDYVQDDVSGSGLPLIQHAQASLAEILKTGRCGLLVDYPVVAAPVSVADQAAGDVRPTLAFYEATSIVNWRTVQRAGKTILSMVVLRECYEEIDGFGSYEKPQYRVLRLDPNYVVEIWQQVKSKENSALEWAMVNSYSPTQGSGQPWTEIPFTFIGAQNNDWNVDGAPLYDIATLNVAHYRNSADYEDSVYLVGQPQFYISGLSEEWRDFLEKKGVYVGARTVMMLPVGGAMGLLQAQPNTLAKEAMASKEAQMAAMGARLIQAVVSVKTATQVNSEDAIAHSVLGLCCTNINSAYTKALGWFSNFANVAGEASLEIPTDFSSYAIDAQTLTALMQAVQMGQMPISDFWARLRAAGLIAADKTDDDIRDEIEGQSPMGGADPTGGASEPDPTDTADDPSGADGQGAEPPAPDALHAHLQALTTTMTAHAAAVQQLAARPDPPAPVVNVAPPPAAAAPTINVAPPAITVAAPQITFAPGSIVTNIEAAPAPNVTVESPNISISPPAITVESPTVNVAAPVVNVQAAPPLRTVPVRGTDGRISELRQEVIPPGGG